MDFTLNNCLKTSLNWLIPQNCIVCNQQLNLHHGDHSTDSYYHDLQCCQSCYTALPFLENACLQCGQSIPQALDYCGQCLESPPNYDQCFCPFRYEAPIKHLIQKLKYQNKPEASRLIAKLVHEELISKHIDIPDLLIPVPMHSRRIRQRGFNQSLLLAKELNKLLHIPYDNNVVFKRTSTTPQAELSFKERQNNLKRSFALKNKPNIKHATIIDDVITTGSTVSEVSQVLKKNGVERVSVWGVAHTVQ